MEKALQYWAWALIVGKPSALNESEIGDGALAPVYPAFAFGDGMAIAMGAAAPSI